jgi:hypothetical protein
VARPVQIGFPIRIENREMFSIARPITLALTVVALCLAPAPADAQLGGLVKKKIGDKLADKAVDKVLPSQQGSGLMPTPEFGEEVLEITSERIAAFLRGMEAEMAAAVEYPRLAAEHEKNRRTRESAWEARQAQYRIDQADFEKKVRAYEDCQAASAGEMSRGAADPVILKMISRMEAMSDADRQRFERRAERLSKAAEAAQSRQNPATAAVLIDSLDALYRDTFDVSFRDLQAAGTRQAGAAGRAAAAQSQCGPIPPAPTPPEHDAGELPDATTYVEQRAARASGMKTRQFAIMRERIASNMTGGKAGFSPAELSVLEAHRAELKVHDRQFRSFTPSDWLR